MKSWIVYIVRCADDTLYTGVTNRLEARIQAHNDGKGAKYTRSRRPVVLEWSIRRKDRGAALSLEYAIKQLSRRQKQAVIRDGLKAHYEHHRIRVAVDGCGAR